jgi:hypothetical protein
VTLGQQSVFQMCPSCGKSEAIGVSVSINPSGVGLAMSPTSHVKLPRRLAHVIGDKAEQA